MCPGPLIVPGHIPAEPPTLQEKTKKCLRKGAAYSNFLPAWPLDLKPGQLREKPVWPGAPEAKVGSEEVAQTHTRGRLGLQGQVGGLIELHLAVRVMSCKWQKD